MATAWLVVRTALDLGEGVKTNDEGGFISLRTVDVSKSCFVDLFKSPIISKIVLHYQIIHCKDWNVSAEIGKINRENRPQYSGHILLFIISHEEIGITLLPLNLNYLHHAIYCPLLGP